MPGGRADLLRPTPIQRFGLLVFGGGFLALFVTLAIAQGIGPPTVPAGDVALVSGVPGEAGQISKRQLRAATAQTLAQGGQVGAVAGSESYEEAEAEAMDRLLKAAWVQGEAAERDLSVSAAQVEAAIADFKQSQRYRTRAQFERFLAAQHLSEAEFEDLARLQVLSGSVQEMVTGAVPAPSPAELERYYDAAKAVQFTLPPTYDLRLILNLDRAKVEHAKAALEEDGSVASWERLARRYSEDPTGRNTGGLHRATPAEFGEPLDAAIAAAPEGALQGPVKTKGVFFIYEVEVSEPGKTESLSAVRPNIVNALTKRDREEALKEFAYEFDAKWRSRTHCADGYVVEGCSGYRGVNRPLGASAACYEEHPRAGIAATSCPAPVAQTVPAMPGTVSILTPQGTALPQRPQPEALRSLNPPG